ncbi:Fur family transcriptional regulator [Deinococcus arenicola]|uniref:Fur family transcriptional regulator n=1 Tax=Deinococcus arenicola TaxID=2994950 RepID=A0ABU4DV51_9DEIO|nr:Fur family transcriptional regulator [Deinococcus sp. ZS9-10]MDV6376323.1 Fur family transcriptional regulator [Deinococcus sp. ZS9-10]
MQQHLERRGLRTTQPRLRLLQFFAQTEGHFTPEDIAERFRLAGEPIPIATLYQNLRVFSEHGLIGEVVGHGGELRYDTNLTPHSHLRCNRCGKLIDIVLNLSDLRPHDQGHDWQITGARVELQGLCPVCQVATATKPTPTL